MHVLQNCHFVSDSEIYVGMTGKGADVLGEDIKRPCLSLRFIRRIANSWDLLKS